MFRFTGTKQTARSRTPATRPCLRIGILEDRSVPSVSAVLFDGTLFVSGSQTGPAADQIHIAGDVATGERAFELIRVFDGAKQIGAFAGVRNIDVRPSGNSTTSIDLNGYQGIDTLAIKEAFDGTNIVRIGAGSANAVAIVGGPGSEVVSVDGLNAQSFDAGTGDGSDHFRFGEAAFKTLNVRAAESVFLTGTTIGTATLDNSSGTMVVQANAFVDSDLRVFTGTGSLYVGGSVGGNVEYVSFGVVATRDVVAARPLPARAELVVGGQIGGSVRMTSKNLDDVARFTGGSAVVGSVTLDMGAGNDSVILGGTIGDGKATSLLVNMGEGQDTFVLLETARLKTPNATVILGEGDDYARVEYGAQFFTLVIYGGNGIDTMDLNGMDKQVVVIDIEGGK